MLFAHLKPFLKLGRLRLRRPFAPHDNFLLAAAAQSLRKLARLRPKYQLQLWRNCKGELIDYRH